jgi:hypothetical protein
LKDFIKALESGEGKSNITRKMAPDDETIQEIASQIKDSSWENIVFCSPNVDEIVRGLSRYE